MMCVTSRYSKGLVVGLAAVAAAPLSAQTTASVTEISFDLNTRYDSNIARSNEARAQLRGLEREDIAIQPTLSIDVSRPFGTNSAFIRGTVGYVVHVNNSRLDRERIQLEAGLDVAAGPCRVRPDAALLRAQTDLADLVVLDNAVAQDFRNTETVQRYGAELLCGGAFGLQPYADVHHETARNSNALKTRAERDSWTYSGGLQYSSPAVGDVRLFVSRDDVDLVGQPLATGTDGYRVTRYGASYSRDIGTRLTLDASLAYTDLESRNPASSGFSGLNWRLAATVQLGERLQVQGSLGKQITNSLASDSAYVVAQPYDLRIRYAVNEKLQLNAGVLYSRRRYEYSVLPTVDAIDRENRRIYDAGLSYRFRDRLQFRAGVGHERRNANGTFFDYRSTFATLGISLSI